MVSSKRSSTTTNLGRAGFYPYITMITKQKIQQTRLTDAHNDFQKELHTHVFFKIQSRQTGEDLVQETFMKTWLYLVKGGKIEMMKAFLYHILNNLIIDEYRKHKTTSLDALLDKGFELSAQDAEPLMDFLDGRKAISLIKRLPPKYRKVMDMRYIQMLSIKEISLIVGQSKNTVAVQTHRGLAKLKALYQTT